MTKLDRIGTGWRRHKRASTSDAVAFRPYLALCLAAVVLLAATLSASAQTRGGTLTWATGPQPDVLAAYLSVSPVAAQIGAKIYDGLLDYDDERRPRPSLAERWEVAPDGRTITFHLRQGVVFHDGQPFTSADVRFSIMDVLRKFHPRGVTIFRNVTAVDTPDAHTAVLQLSEPAPYILSALAAHESPMLPRHALAKVIATPDRAKAALVVGTGPFVVATASAGERLRLTRNAKYWRQGFPLLDAIDVRFTGSDADRAAQLESGAAQVVSGLDTETAHRSRAVASYRARSDGADALTPIAALSLNTSAWPFDNPDVRRAVTLAIDRQALIADAWHGFARPASGPLPAALVLGLAAPSLALSGVAATDAVERANALLDAAGFPRKEDGVRMSIVHDVAPLGPDWQRLTDGIEQQLAKIGIKVSSRFETIDAWARRIGDGEFTLTSQLVYGLSDPALGLHRTLHSAASRNPTPFTNSARWRNADADALMDSAMVAIDSGARAKAYRDLQNLANAEAPMVWLAELTPPVFVHVNARRVMTQPLGLYGNFAEAWIASGDAAVHASTR